MMIEVGRSQETVVVFRLGWSLYGDIVYDEMHESRIRSHDPSLPPRHFSTATPSANASLLASLVLLHLSLSTISDLRTMSHARYERIPTDPNAAHDHDLDQDSDRPLRASVQAEFNRQPPAWWKRGLLLIALFGLGWLAIKLSTGNSKPQVIYATRSVTFHHLHEKS